MPIIKWPDKENKNILNVDADKNCVSIAVYFFIYVFVHLFMFNNDVSSRDCTASNYGTVSE
jgi:hypothetical protein